MSRKTHCFELAEVPDVAYGPFRATTGNVKAAMWDAMEQLLRFIGGLVPRAATVCIRYVYTPISRGADTDSRLRIFVIVRTEAVLSSAFLTLLTTGPMSLFFHLLPTNPMPVSSLLESCYCVVRDHVIADPVSDSQDTQSSHGRPFTCTPFKSNDHNDWLVLDRVLDSQDEEILIDICLEPANVDALCNKHTSYLDQLQKRSRSWGSHDNTHRIDNPLDDDGQAVLNHHVLTPLHEPDPGAQDIRRIQQPLQDTFRLPHVAFRITVLAQHSSTARLIASTVAEAGFEEGCYKLDCQMGASDLRRIRHNLSLTKPIRQAAIPTSQEDCSTVVPSWKRDLLHVASVEELRGIFRLPIAASGPLVCMRANTDPPSLTGAHTVVIGHDDISSIPRRPIKRGLNSKELCRHLLIVGMTGSGKSSSIIEILLNASRLGIPFLVLEPVKTEFRALKRQRGCGRAEAAELARTLKIYTAGNEAVMPFRINPLERIKGITPDEQIDALEAFFHATMSLSGPLLQILREALADILARTNAGTPPTVRDLLVAAKRALDRKGYSPGTRADLGGAVDSRLGGLTRGTLGSVFQQSRSIPSIEQLATSRTVVEMDRLPPEKACVLAFTILIQMSQWLKVTPSPQIADWPWCLLVIDETHILVGPDTDATPSEDNPNPKAYASEFVCRMLAEMRARGVGIIISDQSSSAIATEILKHPASKLAFQQMHEQDRAAIGAAMLFSQQEQRDIARLRPGEAFFISTGYHGPRRIRTVNPHEDMDLSLLPDDELRSIIEKETWFLDETYARLQQEMNILREALDAHDTQRLRIAAQTAQLSALAAKALSRGNDQSTALQAVSARATAIRNDLEEAHHRFSYDEYNRFLPSRESVDRFGRDLKPVRDSLVKRYESVTTKDTRQCINVLNGIIQRCRLQT